jgi:hypothetical protein
LCDEYPCKKYDGADKSDSFITHKNQLHDIEKAKRIGLEAYEAELNNKIEVLRCLLENYDDGRRKSFFCLAVNLLDLRDIDAVMNQLTSVTEPDAPQKVKATVAVQLFEAMAEKRSISLRLRKKL